MKRSNNLSTYKTRFPEVFDKIGGFPEQTVFYADGKYYQIITKDLIENEGSYALHSKSSPPGFVNVVVKVVNIENGEETNLLGNTIGSLCEPIN